MIVRMLATLLLAITLFIAGCSSGGDKEVEVPIDLENASNVGSLQMSISYDANILQAIEVNPEKLGKDAMIESNLDNPGIVIIGIVDSSGINGSGSLVSISFDMLGKSATSSMTINNVVAHNVDTLVDLPTSLIQGKLTDGDVSKPGIVFP